MKTKCIQSENMYKHSEIIDDNFNQDDRHTYITRDVYKIRYINIEFDDEVVSFQATLQKELNENNIKNIELINCIFRKDVSVNDTFKSLLIKNCCFEGKFYINNQYNNPNTTLKIDTLDILDTKFHSNFKLHNCEIKNFTLKDTDFEKNADFFKTKFLTSDDIVFHAINFRGLALFGDTVFKEYLFFEYVTFQGYTHFRQAEFQKGLNLEYANIEKEMNFFGIEKLDTKESVRKTSQETYRIIKYQLQKVGNIIDSNKYHALELQKKKENVCDYCDKDSRSVLDCIVLCCHKVSSNYSTNWIYALLWIVAIGLLCSYVVTGLVWYEEFYKYSSLLTSLDDFCGNYWLFMLNKIALGYLYYQFVTAIRKDTRK